MRILEAIHLRMAGDHPEDLVELVRAAAKEALEAVEARVYRHARVEGDFLISIHRRGPNEGIEVSELGVRLASALRAQGMVAHSVWVGIGSPDKTP